MVLPMKNLSYVFCLLIICLSIILVNFKFLPNKSNLSSIKLLSLNNAWAQGSENDPAYTIVLDGVTVYGSRTYVEGGYGSGTIQWLQYWFNDPVNPTPAEQYHMNRDLIMSRSEADVQFTTTGAQNSWSVGGNVGWGPVGMGVDYNNTRPYSSETVMRKCCVSDVYNNCTHLPPCEAYRS